MCFFVNYRTRFSENSSSLSTIVDCYHDLNLWFQRNAGTESQTRNGNLSLFVILSAKCNLLSIPCETLAFTELPNQVSACPPSSGLLIDVAWYTFPWFIWVVLNFNFSTFLFVDYSNLVDFADQSRERTLQAVDENLCSTRWFRGRPDKSRCRFPAKNTF